MKPLSASTVGFVLTAAAAAGPLQGSQTPAPSAGRSAAASTTEPTSAGSSTSAQGTGTSATAPPAAPASPAPPEPSTTAPDEPLSPPELQVSPHGTLNFRAKGVPITAALELLALETKRNIVAGTDVSGTISLNLFDVTFDQAIAAMTQAQGLVTEAAAGVIYVYSRAEWLKIEEARTKPVSRVFELQFVSATDALEFVKPLISEKGTVAARGAVAEGIETTLATTQGDAYAGVPRLVVHDYQSVIDKVADALKSIDVAPAQVKVECAVVQAKVQESAAFGVDFSFVTSMDFSGGVGNVVEELADEPSPNESETAIVISDTPGLPTGVAPTFSAGAVLSNAAIFLTLLDEVTDTVVIARPSLQVLNRQRATVLIGERLGYLNTTQNDQSTTQSVDFLDTGTKLTLRPFVNPDRTIRMELSPSISTGKVEIKQTSGAIATIPNEFTQELTTNIAVRSGETIVLGGLFQESTTTVRRNVPGASDLPVVGAAFEGQVDQIDRDEIIFLVTPTIVSPERLYDEAEDALQLINQVRTGARQGLLPFARERVSADYAQRAFDAFAAGDPQAASWYADAVLRERPATTSMVRLREQLRNAPGSPWSADLNSRIMLTPPVPPVGNGSEAKPQSNPASTPSEASAPRSMTPQPVEGGSL